MTIPLLPDPLPDGIALRHPATDTAVTYAELAADVERVAAAWEGDKGVVFVLAGNDIGAVTAYLAGMTAGHAVALLDPGLPTEMLDVLVDAYSPELVVGPGRPTVAGLPDGYGAARHAGEGGAVHPDVALLLSTSGTTGSAKMVRLTRQNLESNATGIAAALGIDANERPISSLPIYYSYGLSVINSHFVAGAPVVLTDETILSRAFWELLDAEACTSLAGVPYMYQMMLRVGFTDLELPSLTTITQAGGRLDPALVEQFHKHMDSRGGQMFVMYGQTEATARISVLPAELLPDKIGSVGYPLPSGSIEIDTSGNESEGEVVYSGPNVMMGYATSRADLSAGDELGGVLHTGDLGRLDDDGCLWITGRTKRIAKVFGLRVNLDEIEGALAERGAAGAIEGDGRIDVYCEFDGDLATIGKELARAFRLNHRALALHSIDSLPLTANGKVDYTRLEERA